MSTKPCVWRGQGRLILYKFFNFIPSSSIDLLDQLKIVLSRNIGYVSDISLHVYHLDHHEVLFHNYIFVFNTFFFFKTLAPHQHRALTSLLQY